MNYPPIKKWSGFPFVGILMKKILFVLILSINCFAETLIAWQPPFPKVFLQPVPPKVLVIGDSISSGQSWVTYLERIQLNYSFENLAKAGSNSDAMVLWMTNIDFKNYSYLILLGGINDWWTYEHTVNNLQFIFWTAKEMNPKIKTVFVEYPEWKSYTNWNQYKQNTINIIYTCMMKGPNTDYYVRTPIHSPAFQYDGLHLNDAGKKIYAETINQEVFQNVKRSQD